MLAGRYVLREILGKGGMGTVWRAQHVELGSPVAVKLIDAKLAQQENALTRFRREAKASAALRSPHVVQILDYGVEHGVPYIAMELLEGESLAARLERDLTLSPADTSWIITHVARAIGKAHEARIVHRDLKPDNIFLVRNEDEWVAKVLDFGIAKAIGVGVPGATPAALTTQTGAMLGTPYYMSPEQAQGTRTVDFRSDLWSLGVIAYECLVGRRPFESAALGDLLLRICTQPPPLPSSVASIPVGFDSWFVRACNRNPDERFTSAREMAETLRKVLCVGVKMTPKPDTQVEVRGDPVPASSALGSDTNAEMARTTHSGGAIRLPLRGSPAKTLAIGGVVLVLASAAVTIGIMKSRGLPTVAASASAPPLAAGLVESATPPASASVAALPPQPDAAVAPADSSGKGDSRTTSKTDKKHRGASDTSKPVESMPVTPPATALPEPPAPTTAPPPTAAPPAPKPSGRDYGI